MNNIDALRISQERDRICEWVCDRFRQLIQEDRHDDAICFADEWYEWMDPENHESEITLFYDEEELAELYDQEVNS